MEYLTSSFLNDLTLVVPSVTKLVSMEADGAPFIPLPLLVLRFTGI